MKYDDMSLICARCGEIYGDHHREDCPDGTKDGFVPQPTKQSTKGFQVGNWYRCITPLHMYGEGTTKRKVYKVVEVDQSDDTLKVEGISLWFHFTRFDPTPVPEPPCSGKVPGPIDLERAENAIWKGQPDQDCPWIAGPSAYYIAQSTSPSGFIVEGAHYMILQLDRGKSGTYKGRLRRLTDGKERSMFYNLQRYFIPGPIEPQRTPTEPDPNAWRSACPYDPYGKAAHQAWLARQEVHKDIERVCKVGQLHQAFNRVSVAAGCQASGEQLDHPIALGQPTEDEKPS